MAHDDTRRSDDGLDFDAFERDMIEAITTRRAFRA